MEIKMDLNKDFIFTNSLKENQDIFKKFETPFIENNHIAGAFEFNGFKYTFGEYIKNNLILFNISFRVVTNTNKKNKDKINKLITEQNDIFLNIKFKLNKFEKNIADFSLNSSILLDRKFNIENPIAIIQPTVESLLISFISLKEKLQQ